MFSLAFTIESLPRGTEEILAHFVTPAIVLLKKDAGVTDFWALHLHVFMGTSTSPYIALLIDDYMGLY